MLKKRILVLMFVVAFLLLVGCGPSNHAPILTSSPITTATVGVKYTYDVNATDPDGDTLTYSLATPGGMTINSATGLIKWTPVTAQIGDNPVTVKVSDGTLSITQSFKIKVGTPPPVNQAPTINSIPVTIATVGATYFYVVNATDPDNDVLTYSLNAYPSGMTISSASGLIMWIPTSAQVGNNLVTVMVSDGVLSDTQSFTITVSAVEPEPEPEIELTGIAVDPKIMDLIVGQEKTITSVTATYEIRGTEVPIALGGCTYTSSAIGVATVDAGLVTAVAEGTATIIVNYGGMTDTLEVVVNAIVYRALCVGVGDYTVGSDNDLLGPPYDVDRMIDVFNHCKFGTDEVVFSTPVSLKDLSATKTAIISGIASTFSGADGNDISYFYFSGHGDYTGDFATSYICPTDILSDSYDNDISVNELESALSAIPGTKIVILDSCFSGGFIGKGKEKITISKEDLTSFNNEIINIFFQAEYKGLLTTNQYKVLTSCHSYQTCLETSVHPVDGDPYGYFSAVLCEGCGYNTYDQPYLADNDENDIVSLNEAYSYIGSTLETFDQDVQVYPNNSTYPVVEY